MVVTAETLRGIEAFRTLTAKERDELASRCVGSHHGANEQIISHQEESTDVYFIVSGKVRATIYSQSRRQVSFRDITAGQMFGDLSAIDGKPRSATVVALSDSIIVSMPADVFWRALRRHPEVAEALLKELAQLIRYLSDRVFEFSTLGVKNRIHAELLRLAYEHRQGENSASISPAPTHADIASRISTHREAVTRELTNLMETGLITRASGALIINDVARLEKMVQEVIGH
ncbi:MAG: Crp/Fnr family transcriptional regulator [Acidiferrobacterales bacterium]